MFPILKVACYLCIGAHKRLGFTSIEKAFRVKAIHMQEDFTMETLKHDIAVLELRGSATISDEVSTVCLPSEEPKPGTECFVTGLKEDACLNFWKKMCFHT